MKFGVLIEVTGNTKKIKNLGQDFTVLYPKEHWNSLKKELFEGNVIPLIDVKSGAIELESGRRYFLEDTKNFIEEYGINEIFLGAPVLHWYKDEEEIRELILKRFLEIYEKMSKKIDVFVVNINKISERWYTRGLGCSPFDNPEGLKHFEKLVIDTYKASWNEKWNHLKMLRELKEKVKGLIIRDYVREEKKITEVKLGKGELNIRLLKNFDLEFIIFKERDFRRGVKMWRSSFKR